MPQCKHGGQRATSRSLFSPTGHAACTANACGHGANSWPVFQASPCFRDVCCGLSGPMLSLHAFSQRQPEFPLFATAPNSLSWEKFWDFLSQYNSLVSSPNRLCAFSTGQPVVLRASKAHGTPASTKPLPHSILPGTTCGDLRLPLSSLNGQLAPVP